MRLLRLLAKHAQLAQLLCTQQVELLLLHSPAYGVRPFGQLMLQVAGVVLRMCACVGGRGV